jgi:hypothetical protein
MNRYQKLATVFLRLFAAYLILQALAGMIFILIAAILINRDIVPISHIALDVRIISCFTYLIAGTIWLILSKPIGRFLGGRLHTFIKAE